MIPCAFHWHFTRIPKNTGRSNKRQWDETGTFLPKVDEFDLSKVPDSLGGERNNKRILKAH